MLVFLMPAYFLVMLRETVPIDMTPCISEVIDVFSDILINFLVELARVVVMVPLATP